MKKLILFSVLAGIAGVCAAQQEAGRVIASTPIFQQVSVPRQICHNEIIQTPPTTTGGGAVLGALVGGAVGNSIGGGNGRALATMAGVFGGAIAGDKIEGNNARGSQQNVQRCETQTFMENRVMGYSVVYEYAGRQYTIQMANDPGVGAPMPVQVTPLPSPGLPPQPYQSTPLQPVPIQGIPVGAVSAITVIA